MKYWCGNCRKYFSVKKGTVMERSHTSYRHWAIGTYLVATNLKGVSSMEIHRDLGITQKSAWFMVHRLRESWKSLAGVEKMDGPVEIDEVYLGGLEKNKHKSKKGKKDKTAVVGVKDRSTNKITAKPVPETTKARLEKFVEGNVKNEAKKGLKKNKNSTMQMFKCKDCQKRFTTNYGFENRQFDEATITGAMQMYFSGMSVRDISNHYSMMGVEVNHSTIYRWISDYSRMTTQYLNGIDPSRLVGCQTSSSSGGYRTNRDEAQLRDNSDYQQTRNVYDNASRNVPPPAAFDAACGCSTAAETGSECDCEMQDSCLCDASCQCGASICRENSDMMG